MYDYAIIGGGIVGLSTAWQLIQRYPGKKILLLEKESHYAAHQTGRNSGVIHAGVYYQPGSLKAKFCRAGVEATIAFCTEHDVAFEQCGKLVVATSDVEHERMLALAERARTNGLDVDLLSAGELQRREPNIRGVGAIFVPDTGIVDFPGMCRTMAAQFCRTGGEARLDSAVTGIEERSNHVSIEIRGSDSVETRHLIACGGLMADRLARLQGIDVDFQVIPYRGEYYSLPVEKRDIVHHLIYPVPDPALQFLGVHLNRMIDGTVIVGPNAVQGWKREGYGRLNVSLRDTGDMLRFPGFWKLSGKYLAIGLREYKNSLWKRGYLKRVQTYCPSLQLDDLRPFRTGVRAMAVLRDGTMVDDFLFKQTARTLHVCSAPSPAATSAIPIGNYICDKISA
jgi:L-2-hydroxyglutarate oxidase